MNSVNRDFVTSAFRLSFLNNLVTRWFYLLLRLFFNMPSILLLYLHKISMRFCRVEILTLRYSRKGVLYKFTSLTKNIFNLLGMMLCTLSNVVWCRIYYIIISILEFYFTLCKFFLVTLSYVIWCRIFVKVCDHSRGGPEDFFFNSYYPKV